MKHIATDVLGGTKCKSTHATTLYFDDDDRNDITCHAVEGTSI